jgi:hypothetical protein
MTDLLCSIQGLGVTLDLLKNRAEDALIASLHAYRHIHIINKKLEREQNVIMNNILAVFLLFPL